MIKDKAISGIFGLMVLLGGLGLGVSLIQREQDLTSRASGIVTETSLNKATNLSLQIAEESQKRKKEFVSPVFGFSLTFDPTYWEEVPQESLQSAFFRLSPVNGVGSVKIKASAVGELLTILGEKKSQTPGLADLEKVASLYEASLIRTLPSTVSYLGKELTQRNDIWEYKFIFSEEVLGEASQYFEYLSIHGDFYYVSQAKYAKIEPAASLVERLIGTVNYLGDAAKVKGLFTKDEEKEEVLDQALIAELTKPSVVNILTMVCYDMAVENTGATYVKPRYKVCGGGKGTGFFVNSEGVVATNGHVVKIYPEQALVGGIISGTTADFLSDIIAEIIKANTGIDPTPDQVQATMGRVVTDPATLNSLLNLVYQWIDKGVIRFTENSSRYLVKLSNDPFKIDAAKIFAGDLMTAVPVSETVRQASLVDYEFPNVFSADSVLRQNLPQGTDIGLLKVDNPKGYTFPSVALGETANLKEGDSLLVVGYPGLVEGSSEKGSLISSESSAKATVTQGIVSSIKKDNAGNTLIQSDASVDHGNSGGPAVDRSGKVIGIATYGFQSQSGNFNFMRDVEDLKEMMDKNALAYFASETYDNWYDGLSNFWKSYYVRSLKNFNEVSQSYAIHPLVASYVEDANSAIKKGEDKGGFLDKFGVYLSPQLGIYLSGGLMALGVIGAVGYFLAKRGSRSFGGQKGLAYSPPQGQTGEPSYGQGVSQAPPPQAASVTQPGSDYQPEGQAPPDQSNPPQQVIPASYQPNQEEEGQGI